ncbi:MAG: hypothetical protein LIP00_00050 [Parabacteroides sp.]|nr:hypothetical protein [Parabacteroides sp.]
MDIKRCFILLFGVVPLLCGGCSDDEPQAVEGPKPEMNVLVSPQSGLAYGDKITVSGTLADARNLKMYTIRLKDPGGNVVLQKEQMLLGQSFQLYETLSIPLPADAQAADLQVEVTLDNTRNGRETQTFELPSLRVPVFEKLYLVLGNKSVVELSKNGDVFEAEEFFPANVKGIIATNPANTGLYWGVTGGKIQTMAKDSIPIGGDLEASCKITFNPRTFELTFGERHAWTPLPASDCYYILGTVSGHWQDGEITGEKAKMRMNGYESGNLRYYTWFPPEGDDPETGMWGATAAGAFRMKKGGSEAYVMWDGTRPVSAPADDNTKNFPVTAGGAFEFRVYFEDDVCTKVQVIGSDRTLEFADGQVKVNGIVMEEEVDFAGSPLQLKAGTSYIYESEVALTQGQSVTSGSLDLTVFAANEDLFAGNGNSTWTLTSLTGTYVIRMDAFSGAFYACPVNGYPDVLYMNGWSWAYSETDNAVTWDAARVLPLVRTSGTTYEGSCYVFAWGGDVQFYLTHPSTGQNTPLPNANFTGSYIGATPVSFLLPASGGYYKVAVDLKDGVTVAADGTVTPNGAQPFALNYIPQ